MCSFHLYIFTVEYPTEKDLLKSLENGSVGQIWLFECNAKANFPLMVVKVHHEAPEIGVQITTPEDGRNFSDWVEDNCYYFVEEDDYDDEDCRYPVNVALDQNIRVAEGHTQGCLDVRKFHFLFYFRHQLCYCLEFSDTETPIPHELHRKKTLKIEISTLKLVSYLC